MTYPANIHAITIAKNGGPEVIEKTAISFPKVEPDHIVIKVAYPSPISWPTTDQGSKTEYFGVNFIDTYFRQDPPPTHRWMFLTGHVERASIPFLNSPMSLVERRLG